jgi:diguanylate cyclase (GGDEF)-like protein
MDSNVALAIQCGGILLITLLFLFMRSWIESASLKYWIVSWTSLSLALLSLFIGFHVEPNARLLYSLYFFGEYVFGLLLIAGCHSHMRRNVELANRKLFDARDQLELLVQMDPLTEALNRHAFHSLLRRPENGEETRTSGSVAVIDIDNLKTINDTFGHTVGDKAIRAVARAMRSLVRADDMLFRWGGDEFLVLMFNLSQAETWRRMDKLNEILDDNCRHWIGMPITATVSYGVAGFKSLTELATAIEAADKEMYARRNQVRTAVWSERLRLGEAVEHR